MTSLLELFKFVSSFSLVNAVSTWLGGTSGVGSGGSWPALAQSATFIAFVLLFIRYYHGNSLHVLTHYSQGGVAERLEARLPADFFFVLFEGLILTVLSYLIRDVNGFSLVLLSLFVIDAVWLGFNLSSVGSERYLKVWFVINFFAAVPLACIRLWGWTALERRHELVVLAIVLGHTLLDYFLAWSWYFGNGRRSDAEKRPTIMIAAPFTRKLVDGMWTDNELRECIWSVMMLVEINGYDVYSAHHIENFGQSRRPPEQYVHIDINCAARCEWFIAIADGTESTGLAAEIAVAATHGTKILLFEKRGSRTSDFIHYLVIARGGVALTYSSTQELIEQLASATGMQRAQHVIAKFGGALSSV